MGRGVKEGAHGGTTGSPMLTRTPLRDLGSLTAQARSRSLYAEPGFAYLSAKVTLTTAVTSFASVDVS